MLHQNIRIVRQSQRLSQVALAERAGLNPFYISQLERGLRPARPEHVDAIAAALGIPRAILEGADLAARLLESR